MDVRRTAVACPTQTANMRKTLFNAFPALLLAGAALTLSGCAGAPGMQMARDAQAPAGSSAPRIETITPELVTQLRQQAPTIAPEVRALMTSPGPYHIGPGDILGIIVWEHPQFTMPPVALSVATDGAAAGNGYTVDSEGRIQFAYAGALQVSGLTEGQARERLTQVLSRTLRDPQVTLRVQSYRSQRVYLDGEVKAPGVQPVTDVPMTLPEALNRAGGASPNGDTSRLQLSRKGNTVTINLPALVAAGINPSSILLQNGDLLRVPGKDESRIFVLGEVQRPGALNQRNGRLTLNEALGETAGINPLSGNAGQVYVVRTAPGRNEPTVYHLDAKSPVALMLAEQFDLQPRDVVYVDPAPLANWNRVISLILPTAALANTTNNTIK